VFCIDPVKTCTDLKLRKKRPEHEEILRDPALDCQAQERAGDGYHPGQDDSRRAQPPYDLTPLEIENWVDDAKRDMENALRAKPEDMRKQYERQLCELQEAYGRHAGAACPKKATSLAGQGREVILRVQQGMEDEGVAVSLSQGSTQGR
jgi:hypothetical protein